MRDDIAIAKACLDMIIGLIIRYHPEEEDAESDRETLHFGQD